MTNGNTNILVIGGGKSPTDEMTSFWNQIDTAMTTRTVTFANTTAISTVIFSNFAAIAVVNSVDGSGKLTQAELDDLNARAADVAAFVCGGGGLFVSVELLTNAYKFLPGTPVTVTAESYSDITPTPVGTTLGITAMNLDTGPWHGVFATFPSYLQVLAKNQKGQEAMAWFTGNAGPIDLVPFAAQHGVTMKCNTYYRVKLAVTGLCSPWADTSRLVFLRCLSGDAGPDRCCQQPGGTILGGIPNPEISQYTWTPSAGLSSSSIPNPVFTPPAGATYPLTYTLAVKDKFGCTASDTVSVFCGRPKVCIEKRGCCCDVTLTALTSGQSLLWSTGSTASQVAFATNGTYSVTATNACGKSTASITVRDVCASEGPLPESSAPPE